MLLQHGTAWLDGKFVRDTDIRIHGGVVQEIGSGLIPGNYEAVEDLQGDYVVPGFVDVHIHAFHGKDTMGGEEAVRFMSRKLYEVGVAAFLPTTMSLSEEATAFAVDGIRRVMERQETYGARVLGAHMEAPFLNEKRAGAQLKEFFCDPDWDAMLRMTCGKPETVKLIAIAPERAGAEAFVRKAAEYGIHVSAGHTDANAAQIHRAADWGVDHVTHTFNAQTPLHHREPGVPGASLTDDRYYNELICDGVHLHPDVISLIVRCKGSGRAVMITDAMEAAGMQEGEYALGGQTVTVKNGEARLADGTLAGSVLTMKQAMHNMIHRFGFKPEDVIPMCTSTPAECIGEKKAGRITVGSPAPLTRWSQDWEMKGILSDRSDL